MKTKTLFTAALIGFMTLSSTSLSAHSTLPTHDGDTTIIEANGKKIIIYNYAENAESFTKEIAEVAAKMGQAIKKQQVAQAAIDKDLKDGKITKEQAQQRSEAAIAEMESELDALEARMDELEAELEAVLEQELDVTITDSDSIEEWEEEFEEELEIIIEGDDEDWDDMDWDLEFDSGKRTVGYGDFYLGLNSYMNADGKFPSEPGDLNALSTWGSWHWGLNVGKKTRIGANGPLHIKYGIEYSWKNYNLSQNAILVKSADSVSFVKNDTYNYEKNNINTMWLNVPVLLQLDWSKNRAIENGFNIAVGGYAGLRVGSNTKVKYTNELGDKVKMVNKGNFYMNDVQYGLMAQVGLKFVNLYARYDLSSMFSEGKGPELNGLMFGIVF
jgi:hypothetical protein